MDYNGMLDIVRQQNPGKTYKEQQQLAKTMYQNFKNASKNFDAKGAGSPGAPLPEGAIPIGNSDTDLLLAEKRIRAGNIDVNAIISIGREVIPDGTLVKHGKNGVNTMVTFENKEGRRIPEIGTFSIYI
jgi:hypothetical protein